MFRTAFLSLASSLALVAPHAVAAEKLDCARELAEARRLFREHASARMRFAAPLESAMRQVVDRVLGDEDRALVQAFARGDASAADVDRRLWPKLRPALARFNGAGCRDLGGAVAEEDAKTELVGMRARDVIHTSVLVTCARAALQGETRRYLGLRVRRGEGGTTLSLHGFIQTRTNVAAAPDAAEWSGVVVDLPLGDRAAAGMQLGKALASWTGTEADFTWAVPAACRDLVSSL